MDYGRLFRRAADIVWTYKYLILLGILAAFSSGTGGGSGFQFQFSGDGTFQNGEFRVPDNMPFPGGFREVWPVVPAIAILLICLAVLVGIALYILGTIARGGLIAGVDAAERGEKTTLGEAWGTGWRRGWTLIGIGLIPAIPAFIGFVVGLGGLAAAGGLTYLGDLGAGVGVGLGGLFGLLACILLPLSLVLSLLRTFANRAAMLEGTGVVDSYSRGFSVLMANLGPALVIFIIQVVISLVLGFLLVVPGILIALCCILWPLLLLFQGFMAAFFSGVWTLAWRAWTGKAPVEKVV